MESKSKNSAYQSAYRARMKADKSGGRLNADLDLKTLDNLAYIAEHHKITKRAMLERLIDAEAEKLAIQNVAQSTSFSEANPEDRMIVQQAQQKEREQDMQDQRDKTRAMMRASSPRRCTTAG